MIEHKNVESVIRYYLMFLPPKHVDSILNIGGGIKDTYEGVLKRRCYRYANIDIRSSPKVDYVCDITKGTPFAYGEWEWGWCSEVLEHIPKRKQKKFVDEVTRICKNVVFTYPTKKHPTFHDDPGHVPVIVNFIGYASLFDVDIKETKTGRVIVRLMNRNNITHMKKVDEWLN